MTHAATSLPPAPDSASARLGWLLLLPVGVLIVVQIVFAGATGGFDLGGLGGPDSYMHLVRAQALEAGGSWFDPRELRVGPPDGHVQHWTRPFDLLLWLGAKVLSPVLGFDAALLLFGQLVSPLILIAALVALDWASAPLLDREARFLACLLLLLQPAVLAYTGLGRADHHSLLLLLFLIMLGFVVRALDPAGPPERRVALSAGVVGAFALWISTEALVFIGTFMLALGLPWLLGERRLMAPNRDLALATAATLGMALLIERGGHDPLALEADRISVVHVVLFALITGFWWLAARLPWLDAGGSVRRLMASLAGAASLGLIMLALFPVLRHGILGEVDPLYRELRLERIFEIQPPLRPDWLVEGEVGRFLNRLLFWFGLALVALPVLGRRLVASRSAVRRRWLPVSLGLAVTVPLMLYQWRWGIYAQSLLVIAYALALRSLLDRLGGWSGTARLPLVRTLAIMAGLFWAPAAAMALPDPPPVETASDACPVADLAPVLNRLDQQPRTIMTMADLGAELLYRTRHRVLSIPNHRPQPGFAATVHALASDDPERARTIIAANGVDWVLLCGSGPEADLFARAGEAPRSLYRKLRAGSAPRWLRRVSLGGLDASGVLLFETRTADVP